MNIYLDCYPCVLRQALDAARRTGVDEHIQFNIIRGILRELLIIPAEAAPPEITARIHRLIKQESGNETIEESLQAKLDGNDYRTFEGAIHDASRILYLGDNAGEIVFDRILIEEIHKCTEARVTFVVKGEPILNDATLEDDLFIGMDTIAEVITNGYDAPATILSRSSRELQETWKDADLIISKGQGNYESLSDVRGNIFFLLKVKCSVLATDVGSDVGQSILRKGIGRAVSRIEAPPM